MRKAAPGQDFDVIVVGGGVNGLVCATLLAQAQRRVIVLEARDRAGGMCVTAEMGAGHRVSAFSSFVGPFDPAVMKALRLQKHGLQFTARNIGTIALAPDGRHIVLGDDLRHTAQSLQAHAAADARAWPAFETRLRRAAQSLQRWIHEPPGGPADGPKSGGFFAARPAGKGATPFDDALAADLDRSISELLDDVFTTPLLKGAIALDAILGNAMAPSAPGTAFLAVMQRALDAPQSEGRMHPTGGAGAFIAALLRAAEAAGVQVRTGSRATNLLFDAGRLAGVELAGGTSVYAPVVVSSLDPATTLLGLGAEREVPLGLKRRLTGFRKRPSVARVNLALSALPTFKGLDRKYLRDRMLVCPGTHTLERSFAAFETGVLASELAMEIALPTVHDPSLAPPGQHVLSASVTYVPEGGTGSAGDAARTNLIGAVGSILRQYAPDLPDLVVAADVYTPADLGEWAGGAGAHWHGGDLAPDQLGPLRPATRLSRHDTPIHGLFLCGAGTHPCGGITGVNGRNAAEAVLSQVQVTP